MKATSNTHWRICRIQYRLMREDIRKRPTELTDAAYRILAEMWQFGDRLRFLDRAIA